MQQWYNKFVGNMFILISWMQVSMPESHLIWTLSPQPAFVHKFYCRLRLHNRLIKLKTPGRLHLPLIIILPPASITSYTRIVSITFLISSSAIHCIALPQEQVTPSPRKRKEEMWVSRDSCHPLAAAAAGGASSTFSVRDKRLETGVEESLIVYS